MTLEELRKDIIYRRRQIDRQRREILGLQKLGIPTKDAEELLDRMLNKVDQLCEERGRLMAERDRPTYPGTTKIRGTQRRGL